MSTRALKQILKRSLFQCKVQNNAKMDIEKKFRVLFHDLNLGHLRKWLGFLNFKIPCAILLYVAFAFAFTTERSLDDLWSQEVCLYLSLYEVFPIIKRQTLVACGIPALLEHSPSLFYWNRQLRTRLVPFAYWPADLDQRTREVLFEEIQISRRTVGDKIIVSIWFKTYL